MIGKVKTGGIVAFINVSCPNSSLVTVSSNGAPVISMQQAGTNMQFKLPRIGDWIVTASYNGLSETRTINVGAGQTQNVTMLTGMYLYNQGSYAPGFTGGWTVTSGASDQGSYIHASTGSPKETATSRGTVNLRGYQTISAYIAGAITPDNVYGIGEIAFNITDSSGQTVLLQHKERVERNRKTFDMIWSFDVRSIIQDVKFQITAQSFQGATSTINLYSIYLSTT